MDKVVNKVLESIEYEKFNFLKRNRDIDMKHVENLKASFSEKGQLVAITVTRDMEVTDGQHRLMAAKLLGLPIRYIVDDNVKASDVIEMNTTQKKWSIDAYLSSYAQTKDSFKRFNNLKSKTGLSAGSLYVLLFGTFLGGKRAEEFRNGVLSIGVQEERDFGRRWDIVSDLSQVNNGVFKQKIQATKFLYALIFLIDHPEYNHGWMLRKLTITPKHHLTSVNNVGDGILMIQSVYNQKISRSKSIDLEQRVKEVQSAE